MGLAAFSADVTISNTRYAELIRAEQDAARLKAFLANQAWSYRDIPNSELRLLCAVLGIAEGDNDTDS